MSFKTIFIASAMAATSLVNAAVLPRQEASTGPSCTERAPLETFRYKATSKKQFEITCGADYYGSDLGGVKWPGSFEGCLELCDDEPLCLAVSWNGGCYMKGGVPALVTGNTGVWAAIKNPPPTCEALGNSDDTVFTSTTGDFDIICGKDYGGNDLDAVDSASFADCIEACASNEQCVDVSFNYGRCYLKNAIGDLSDNGGVWTAKRVDATPIPTVPTPETPKSLSCIENVDDKAIYGDFTVQCGNDHSGADMGAISGTFEECMDACSANSECITVSWVWGTCYMKSAAHPGQLNVGHVWGAIRTSALTSADNEGIVSADNEGTVSADNEGTVSADNEGTVSADNEGTVSADNEGIVSADNEGTVSADNEGTVSVPVLPTVPGIPTLPVVRATM